MPSGHLPPEICGSGDVWIEAGPVADGHRFSVATFDDSGGPENGPDGRGRPHRVDPAVQLSRIGTAEPQNANAVGVDPGAPVKIQTDPARPVAAKYVDDAAMDRLNVLGVQYSGQDQHDRAAGIDSALERGDVVGKYVHHENTPRKGRMSPSLLKVPRPGYPVASETNP